MTGCTPFSRLVSGLLMTAFVGLSCGAVFAQSPDVYSQDEDSGRDVPSEFKLKYQVPSSWLLQEDESDLFGARSSWRGTISLDYRYFFEEGLYPDQSRDDVSVILEPEYSLTWPAGHFFAFTPYVQVDNRDNERTHVDVRELYGMMVGDSFELSAGVRKIFWGVTESQNLVDIINQQDLVTRGKRTDKLGQPMVNLSILKNWGTVDLFVMPYFRERTFPGEDGRLRTPLAIETDDAEYESGAEETHIDLAIRYSHYIGGLEFGLSLFDGTSRDPDIRGADFVPTGNPLQPVVPTKLIPYYYQMTQVGFDGQYIAGAWLLKAEVINRTHDLSEIDDYTALTTGFEYTFTGVLDSETDFSILSEWLYDERGDESPTLFENDIMVGARLAFNDVNSTEMLLSFIQDLDESSMVISFEGSRRLTDHWKISVDAYWWFDDGADDLLYLLRNDDFISCNLAYHF
jgi:hypothetical protein